MIFQALPFAIFTSSTYHLVSFHSPCKSPLCSCRAGLAVNKHSLVCLLGNVLIPPSLSKDSFSLSTLNTSTHCLLAYKVSDKKSAQYLTGERARIPVCAVCWLSLIAFRILSLESLSSCGLSWSLCLLAVF